jgi:hypothetical protein
VVSAKIPVFYVVAPYSLVEVCQHFREVETLVNYYLRGEREEVKLHTFLTLVRCGQLHTPAALAPEKDTQYLLDGRLGETQWW